MGDEKCELLRFAHITRTPIFLHFPESRTMSISSRRNGFDHPLSSDITPHSVYQDRRALLRLAAGGAVGAALTGWVGGHSGLGVGAAVARPGKLAALAGATSPVAGAVAMEKLTSYQDASTYKIFTSLVPTNRPGAQRPHTQNRRLEGRD